MASRPYKASDYLKDPQDRAAYLNEILESGDFDAFLLALQNLAETTQPGSTINMVTDCNSENMKLTRLNTLLHDLGLKLSIEVLQPVNIA